MSVLDQCISTFLAATRCADYHGKWISTIAWKHILFHMTKEKYTEQAVTKALKQTKYNLESASTCHLKMVHTKKWVECSLSDQKVKKNVNFFYIHESSKTHPIIESETQIWKKRYNLYVSKYPPWDIGKICGRKNPLLQ